MPKYIEAYFFKEIKMKTTKKEFTTIINEMTANEIDVLFEEIFEEVQNDFDYDVSEDY